MFLAPLGAGTLEQAIIRPVILNHKVIRFIAEKTDKINLSAIQPHLSAVFSLRLNLLNC